MKQDKNKVLIYDTTLRDGAQGEEISFSLDDKLKVVKKLDSVGFHYIEGGWPGSNPKDILFFKEVKKLSLKNAKVTAFGSTRYKGNSCDNDPNLKAIVDSKVKVTAIFGKSWDFHVQHALRATLDENLEMIYETLKWLKLKGMEVIYDAEHFFDGFTANSEYALQTLKKAQEAGVDNITLCDTNGTMMPNQVREIVGVVKERIKVPLGIHAHNDSDTAVANSLMAVLAGCVLVQGTINGYGERCGNANLCSIIPNLKLKMGVDCIDNVNMKNLTKVCAYIDGIANVAPNNKQPFVGKSAFAHKGGIHISAVERDSRTYEHVNPELVGNKRRFLISELSGKSAVLLKAKEFNINFRNEAEISKLLKKVKELEHFGYQFEEADGTLELLMRKTVGKHRTFFKLKGFRTIIWKDSKGFLKSEAIIKISVKGKDEVTVSEGDGPVAALDSALRKALESYYPELKEVTLYDFKVRVVNASGGTRAKVRVLIESRDKKDTWATVGVSENIIEASWQALVDSIEYKLLKEKQ